MKKKPQLFSVLIFFFLSNWMLGQSISPKKEKYLSFAMEDFSDLPCKKDFLFDSFHHLPTTNQPFFLVSQPELKSDLSNISMNQSYQRYQAPQNLINVRLSPLTSFLEYQHCVRSEKTYRGRFKTRSKYLYAQLGIHPFNFPDGYAVGFKMGETFDHIEMSGGVFFSFGSNYAIVLPSISYGYTTLGLKSKIRFNVGVGFPEFFYLGTAFVLD